MGKQMGVWTHTCIYFTANDQLGISYPRSDDWTVLCLVVYNVFFAGLDEFTWSSIPWRWDKREWFKFVAYAKSLSIRAPVTRESTRGYPRKPSYPVKRPPEAFFDLAALPSDPFWTRCSPLWSCRIEYDRLVQMMFSRAHYRFTHIEPLGVDDC